MNPAEEILRTLARHLRGPAHLRLMGGAAIVLGYGLDRMTEDADLLHDEREIEALIEDAAFGDAVVATNRELEPDGLYVTHIWGPEQQILTPEWPTACRALDRDFGNELLRVSVLGPLDLVLSKLCRFDDGDVADARYLIRRESIAYDDLARALDRAVVPSTHEEAFRANRDRALSLADR